MEHTQHLLFMSEGAMFGLQHLQKHFRDEDLHLHFEVNLEERKELDENFE